MATLGPAELPDWGLELLAAAPVGRLAFVDDRDRPRALPVTFALTDDEVWSAIDRKPKRVPPERIARVRYLRRRPQAALVVDRYDDDWERLAWVQVLGEVTILDPDRGGAGLEALSAKYAQYRESPPDGPLLRLDPESAVAWRAAEG